MYARVSWGYELIRAQVCELSDAPPDYFLCDELLGIPLPSKTFAPVPETSLVNVLVQINLDQFPTETSWYIENAEGEIVHEVPLFSYTEPSATVTERVSLDAQLKYNFVLMDSFGDGSEYQPGKFQ